MSASALEYDQQSELPSALSSTSSRSQQLQYFRESCDLDDHAARMIVRAERLQEKGQLEQAALYFKEVIRISPNCVEAKINLEMIERARETQRPTWLETLYRSAVGFFSIPPAPTHSFLSEHAAASPESSTGFDEQGLDTAEEVCEIRATLTAEGLPTPSACPKHCWFCSKAEHGLLVERINEDVRIKGVKPGSPADVAGVTMGAIISRVEECVKPEDMLDKLLQVELPFTICFKTDIEFAMARWLRGHDVALLHAGRHARRDAQTVFKALDSYNGDSSFQYAAEELRDDEDFMLKAVQRKPRTCAYASDRLKKSRDFILAVVRVDGRLLQYASEELQDDEDVVQIALQQNAAALQYASSSIRFTVQKLRRERHFQRVAGQARRVRQFSSSNVANGRSCHKCRRVLPKSAYSKTQWKRGYSYCWACVRDKLESIDEPQTNVSYYDGPDDPDRYMGHGEFDDGLVHYVE